MEANDLVNWQQVLDNYLLENQDPFVEPDEKTFRASSLGCLRQCVKQRLGMSKMDLEGLRNCQIGTNLHRFIQTELALGYLPHPMQFEKKVAFEHAGIKFTGHVDCWDGNTIYDFKSTANSEFSMKYPTNKAYLMQLSVYAYALKAKRAVLVYVDKRNYKIEMKEIEIIPIDDIVKFCNEVIEYTKKFYDPITMLQNPDFSLPDRCRLPNGDFGCYVCKYKELDSDG